MFEGKVWRYGDNIDTDVIIPARYLNTFEPKALAAHCMEDIDTTFAKEVVAGDIMVGGKNFGCGSSREHAPIAIAASGVPVVRFSIAPVAVSTRRRSPALIFSTASPISRSGRPMLMPLR